MGHRITAAIKKRKNAMSSGGMSRSAILAARKVPEAMICWRMMTQ
jgi:hypothetical protein